MNELRAKYPVFEGLQVLDGVDLYRSSNLVMALVVVQSAQGKDMRFYRWRKRLDKKSGQDVWKVDLARFSVQRWDWAQIAAKVGELKARNGLT